MAVRNHSIPNLLHFVPKHFSYYRITDIKYNSPAHISGKIEDGDEIIQINYQTVVGWHYNRVLQQLQESPPDVLLTLKKRPRHTKIYGQIYIKPYRLPSKKRSLTYRFGDNLPSPRIEFIPPQNFPVLLPLTEKSNLSDSDTSSNSSIPAETTKTNEKELRLYLPNPRTVLQRRHTICGDQVSGFRGNITFWHEMNIRRNIEGISLRDKSVSFGFGLEISPVKRPITCIGIHNNDKFGDLANGLNGSLPDITSTNEDVKQTVSIPIGADGRNVMISQLKETESRNKNDTKQKIVKFNTTDEVIENRCETIQVDETIANVEDRNTTHENPTMSTDSEETSRSLVKTKQEYLPKECRLAEAINVTLIKTKVIHEAVLTVNQGKISSF